MRTRTLILSLLAAFAFSAVAASAASAAEPQWYTGEPPVLLNATETISSEGGPFTLEAPGLVTIKCTSEMNTGKIFATKPGTDEATVKFTGCSVVGAEATCKVKEPITTEAKTVLEEVGGKVYDIFSPKSGTIFTTIVIENQPGKTCLVAGTYIVTGNTAGLVGPAAVNASLTFSKANSVAAGTVLKLGGHTAYLSGTSLQHMTGAHIGQKLSAH